MKNIKHKWFYCPNCKDGKMIYESENWVCDKCKYTISDKELNNNFVYWFCDNCGEYLNTQTGFDKYSFSHTCTKCGYRNITTNDNIVKNKKDYKEIAKKIIKGTGMVVAGIATAVVTMAAVLPKSNNDDDDEQFADIPFYSNGFSCMNCGQSLSGGIHVSAWEEGNNSDPYVVCPHCRSTNILWDD